MNATGAPSLVGFRWGRWFLVAGGATSALNGAVHFVLPVMYSWDQHAADLYDPVRWALFATTWFFALLLVLVGILTILLAMEKDVPARVIGWVALGMAAFWVVGALYEIAVPFPAAGASWGLPAFSIFVALLHVAGFWMRLRRN